MEVHRAPSLLPETEDKRDQIAALRTPILRSHILSQHDAQVSAAPTDGGLPTGGALGGSVLGQWQELDSLMSFLNRRASHSCFYVWQVGVAMLSPSASCVQDNRMALCSMTCLYQ
jgi:hypothetical protein